MQLGYSVPYGPPQPPCYTAPPLTTENQLFHIRHQRAILLVLECLAFLGMMLVVGTRVFLPHWVTLFGLTFIAVIWYHCTEVHALEDSIPLPKSPWRK